MRIIKAMRELVRHTVQGFVLRLIGWKFTESPKDGNCYWVAMTWAHGISVFEATAFKSCFNGWGNGDTWEDFDNRVLAWKKMRKPWFPQNPVVRGATESRTSPPRCSHS